MLGDQLDVHPPGEQRPDVGVVGLGAGLRGDPVQRDLAQVPDPGRDRLPKLSLFFLFCVFCHLDHRLPAHDTLEIIPVVAGVVMDVTKCRFQMGLQATTAWKY